MNPIFLLSLPRSGSTLIQRALATHPDISTTSEPWILLPFIYSLRTKGHFEDYDPQHFSTKAIEDFYNQFPNKKSDYIASIRELTLSLYQKASPIDTVYFLDKTPRYHLIINELLHIFPTAKFIIIWRNPLAIAASTMDTWSKGKWNLHRHHIDFHNGLNNLIEFSKKNKECIHTIKFEDFVTDPQHHYQRLMHYLELNPNKTTVESFNDTKLNGRMGDPTGIIEYNSINNKSIEKWKKTMTNPWRTLWCYNYLRYIGKENLQFMGYDINELKKTLPKQSISTSHIFSDVPRILYGKFYTIANNLKIK